MKTLVIRFINGGADTIEIDHYEINERTGYLKFVRCDDFNKNSKLGIVNINQIAYWWVEN